MAAGEHASLSQLPPCIGRLSPSVSMGTYVKGNVITDAGRLHRASLQLPRSAAMQNSTRTGGSRKDIMHSLRSRAVHQGIEKV